MSEGYQTWPKELLTTCQQELWERLSSCVEERYDMDILWNKGFGSWVVEKKYRRGGKTLCTFYAREGECVLLVTLGKAEREKFDAQREAFSEKLTTLYDQTTTYHDGKWLWITMDETLALDDVIRLLMIKRRPNRK